MKPPLLLRLAATLLLLAAAGCGKATSPITSVLSFTGDDVAGTTPVDLAYNSVDRDLQASDSLGHGPCGAVGFPLGIPAGCPYDAASTSFVCGPEILRDGLTRTFSYQFLDASGAPQSAYDAIATASIHFTSHIGGTSRRRGRTSVVDDHRDLTLSGLAGTETTRIWNGTGTSSRQDSVSMDSGTAIINLASTTTVANVVVPAPWARDSWPLSGTVTSHLVTSRGIDQTAVITFNGTRFVPLTIGGTTVTIDLARWLRGGPGGPIGGGPHGRRPGRRR